MTTRLFGSGIRRREDPRLITGQAAYTDDIKLAGLVHAAILRSPHAHACIRSIDTTAAAQAPGVLAVYTGADTAGLDTAWTNRARHPALPIGVTPTYTVPNLAALANALARERRAATRKGTTA